ncbi:MAG: N-acetylmuramoyl-L-alanine amidase [Clostridiales bacterium]|nr:N-acetylmuramoyl-L-alanine amidase [Clostridiales bacterium]
MSQQLGRLTRALCVVALSAGALFGAADLAWAGRVFIDPGHGGSFPGAVYGGVTEANINLAIARELDTILRQSGHQTALSRTADVNTTRADIPTWRTEDSRLVYATNGVFNVFDDLQARCDTANRWGADVFVSIHANAAVATSANGAETFWRNQSTTDRLLSARLAEFVQREYIAETGLASRGVKTAQFYVLRWSNMPAILVETGFMSNSSDLKRLRDPAFQRRAARGIARGIELFLASEPFTRVYPRIAGENRFDTARAIADAGWPLSTNTVILTSGTSWPDALSGVPLSRRLGAPVLLTTPEDLHPSARTRIAAQAPTRIVVLGGEAAVSTTAVASAVEATGREPADVTVDRIAGQTRYETAAAIARQVGVPADGRVIIASGQGYADALSIAPFAGMAGMPILLVETSAVPEATRQFITENAARITRFEIIGGTGAVSAAVATELGQTAQVIRVAGTDRWATNVRVVERYAGAGSLNPLVATGQLFPDALTAGALAATQRRPLLLVGDRLISPHTRRFLVNNAARVADPTVVGGPASIAHQTDWMIRKSLER